MTAGFATFEIQDRAAMERENQTRHSQPGMQRIGPAQNIRGKENK
jgi:hypothetical protein